MEITPSFPPADALLATLREVDYKRHYNRFQDSVEVALLVLAAVATVLYSRASAWWRNGGGDRVKGAVETAYLWVRLEAVPEAQSLYRDLKAAYGSVSRPCRRA